MADLFEEATASWLMARGYFILHGMRFEGQGELDFLAVRLSDNGTPERLHVEVHVSENPITNIGQKKAGKGTDAAQGARQFVQRKFFRPQVVKTAQRLLGSQEYGRLLILGNVNNQVAIMSECRKRGVKVTRFWQISKYLRTKPDRWETTDGRRLAQLMRLDRQVGNRPNF